MGKRQKRYARVIENVIVVKKGYSPLPILKNTVLPVQTEDKGSGFVVLLAGERGVTLQTRSVSFLSREETTEFKKQMVKV